MSFWDSVKKIGVSAKCLAGMHEGNFQHIQGKPKCHAEKTCPNCNKNIEDIFHKYTRPHYVSEHSCDFKSSCEHCGEEKIVEKHNYEHVTEKCNLYKICYRCKSKKFVTEDHHWIQSPVLPNGDFEKQCLQCGARRLDKN